MASTLKAISIDSRKETPSARTFCFELDSGGLDYRPGQYITVRLEGIEDPRGPQRPFTLSSSPTEKGQISITSEMTGSPFKEALQKIAAQGNNIEEQLKIRGPMGDFTLDMERPALMIAGGIGITPFRSMIRYVRDQGADLPIVLLYSNSTLSDITFRDELDAAAGDSDALTVVHTLTRSAESGNGWSGRTGRIDSEVIAEAAGPLEKPVYYVCGPPDMVTAMTGIVQDELDVAESDLRAEKFTGY